MDPPDVTFGVDFFRAATAELFSGEVIRTHPEWSQADLGQTLDDLAPANICHNLKQSEGHV